MQTMMLEDVSSTVDPAHYVQYGHTIYTNVAEENRGSHVLKLLCDSVNQMSIF